MSLVAARHCEYGGRQDQTFFLINLWNLQCRGETPPTPPDVCRRCHHCFSCRSLFRSLLTLGPHLEVFLLGELLKGRGNMINHISSTSKKWFLSSHWDSKGSLHWAPCYYYSPYTSICYWLLHGADLFSFHVALWVCLTWYFQSDQHF